MCGGSLSPWQLEAWEQGQWGGAIFRRNISHAKVRALVFAPGYRAASLEATVEATVTETHPQGGDISVPTLEEAEALVQRTRAESMS